MRQIKPIIQGSNMSILQSKPLTRQLPKLFLHKTKNTIVTCTVCRGQRLIAVKSPNQNKITYTRCLFCHGTGTTHNDPYKFGDGRNPIGI